MAIELVVGNWVLCDSMRDDDETNDAICLGRFISKPDWGGQGVCKMIQAGG